MIKKNVNIEEVLNKAGVKATAQRIAVCRYVLNEADHPTAEEVKTAVDAVFPKISLATVYNTLNTLVEVGLLKAVRVPHGNKVVFDWNTSDHYHFINEEDGSLLDLDAKDISVVHNLNPKYQVNAIDVFLKGTKS